MTCVKKACVAACSERVKTVLAIPTKDPCRTSQSQVCKFAPLFLAGVRLTQAGATVTLRFLLTSSGMSRLFFAGEPVTLSEQA